MLPRLVDEPGGVGGQSRSQLRIAGADAVRDHQTGVDVVERQWVQRAANGVPSS